VNAKFVRELANRVRPGHLVITIYY
jgi:hypothetical protein